MRVSFILAVLRSPLRSQRVHYRDRALSARSRRRRTIKLPNCWRSCSHRASGYWNWSGNWGVCGVIRRCSSLGASVRKMSSRN